MRGAPRGALAAALGAMLVATLAACGGGGGGSSDEIRVVASFYSREPAFIQASAKGLEQAATEKGWTIEFLYANNDPTTQVSQIENAITTQPDAIISWANDREAVIPVARRAKEAGIAVFTMGQDFGTDGADARLTYVGPLYEDVGRDKAQFMVDQLGGQGKIAIVRGIRGADFTEKQGAGAKEIFDANPGIEVVGEIYAGAYTADAGLTSTQNIITANPDIVGLYVDNDDIAVGSVQAAREAGILDNLVIVGTDGTPAGLEAVSEGDLDYTVALCGVDDGKRAIEALYEFLVNEVDPPARVDTLRIVITPDTYEAKAAELATCN